MLQKIYQFILPALAGTLICTACKKEYEHTPLPYKSIESFAVLDYAGDTLRGVITQDTIYLYWDAGATRPETIKTFMSVSDKATVSPASETAVPFAKNASFTVTAEDKSTHTYFLKVLYTEATPVISSVNNLTGLKWHNSLSYLVMNGQYFLASGDALHNKVFAQREKDGYEFDLVVDVAQTNTTLLIAGLPPYTAEMDTGWHKMKLTLGSRTVELGRGWIGAPPIDKSFLSLVSHPGTVYAGDELKVKVDDRIDGRAFNWYKNKITTMRIRLSKTGASNVTLEFTDLTIQGNVITFRVPEAAKNYAGYNMALIYIGYPNYQFNGTAPVSFVNFNPGETTPLLIGARP